MTFSIGVILFSILIVAMVIASIVARFTHGAS